MRAAAARAAAQSPRRKEPMPDGQLLQGGAAEAGAVAEALQNDTKYIYFERDEAGFNNIRLQLESMVAIAAVTGRTLVLPPPGVSDHAGAAYYEFAFFDAAAFSSVVNMSLWREPDDQTFRVEEALAQVDLAELPDDQDWFFSNGGSRIQHFECLRMSDRQRAVAAYAVLHGLAMDHHLEEMASSNLQSLALADLNGGFDCVHIRRGDFRDAAPEHLMSDEDEARKISEMLPDQRPLLVLSDEVGDERPKLDLGRRILFANDAYVDDVSLETRAAVDMIMCSRGEDFVGTPGSTFTNGIFELRQRASKLQGGPEVGLRLFGQWLNEPRTEPDEGELCWNKVTTFRAISLCSNVSATSCF